MSNVEVFLRDGDFISLLKRQHWVVGEETKSNSLIVVLLEEGPNFCLVKMRLFIGPSGGSSDVTCQYKIIA